MNQRPQLIVNEIQSRRKKIIKIREAINELENRESVEKSQWYYKLICEINKIDKTPARLVKVMIEDINSRNVRIDITIDSTDRTL